MSRVGLENGANRGRQPIVFETLVARGPNLRVEFDWRGDRWSQTIGLVDHAAFHPLLASQEDSGDSPPQPD
ncbi:MAG: hypothetical protein ACC645_26640 [Pirellulales bacterium]